MQQIIGLYGKHDSGKTETLNWLIALLDQAVNNVPLPIPPTCWTDRREVFVYNGKIIAIATGGDDANAIQQNCAFFVAKKCDIAISATRTRGQTCDALCTFAQQQGLSVNYIRKMKTVNAAAYYQTNFLQAQQIFASL